MIYIGTSGYQFKEWCGHFYPEKFATAKMLAYYAERLSTVEINYSFNRVPPETVLTKWMEQTPANFKFTLKAHKRLTHSKVFSEESLLQFFVQRAKTLADKQGVILFQFPPTLKKDFGFLTKLIAELPNGTRAAFEFRHKSWFEDELYDRLRSKNLALCIAESEDIVTPTKATADYGYFRLRLEEYSADLIAQRAKDIKSNAEWKDVFVYFKHEGEGTGPKYARQLMEHFDPKVLPYGKVKADAPTSLFE
jgi:uncharacterized protein YecE (DUF72 family)